MGTSRLSSGSEAHPTPKDVIRALLSRLIERGDDSAWAHFEVIAEGGWVKNLLQGKEPWVEVACVGQQSVQLNPGIPMAKRSVMPGVPERWQEKGQGLWHVPVTEAEDLIAWIDGCLAAVSGNPSYRVSGWMDGL